MRAPSICLSFVAIFLLAAGCAISQQGSQPSMDERFQRLDRDRDGKLTPQELPGEWFGRLDTNSDGVVTQEATAAMGGQGTGQTPPAVGTPIQTPPAAAATTWQQGFVPDAPYVGEIKGSYVDPEFSEGANQVVFQDTQNRVWIGDIDPTTGLFRTATGRDYLMDENITIIFDRPPQGRKFSTNGPEWTRDDQGYCVVYTKVDAAGIMQQWLARLVDGRSVVTHLTHGATDCYGNMPSRFQDGRPPRIAYTYEWPIWNAKAAWIFVDKPDEPHQLAGFDYRQMSMWSAVSPEFLFVQRQEGSPYGQVAKANADTGEVQVLTNDEGQKDDPGLFAAPEFGGEICLMANVDSRAIAIYRDLRADGFWTRVATLTLPDEFPYQFIVAEYCSRDRPGRTSYVALLARERTATAREASGCWGWAGPENRVVRRIDHAANLPAPRRCWSRSRTLGQWRPTCTTTPSTARRVSTACAGRPRGSGRASNDGASSAMDNHCQRSRRRSHGGLRPAT